MFVACDESGVDPSNKYLVIGSVWLDKKYVAEFEKRATELRLKNKCWGEVEWLKLKKASSDDIISFYKDFVSLAFKDIKIYFRFIIVEKNKLKMKEFHEKNKELVHLKFMYFSISRYAETFLDMKSKEGLHIIFDNFNECNASKEKHWRKQTKGYIERHLGCNIEHLQPCNSHISSLVQLCDLFTGAVSTVWNFTPSDISASKLNIINHMKELTGKNFGAGTLPTERDFNIWV
jgi:hypothetical protein